MSNEMNLPWVSRIIDDDDDGFREVVDAKEYLIGIFPTHIAAHIVKCVNAHDGLVEALKVAIERDEAGVTMTHGQMQDARAALAAATGEQK